MEAMHSGHFIDVVVLKTFYIKRGDGHPLILCHRGSPGTCSSVNWKLAVWNHWV